MKTETRSEQFQPPSLLGNVLRKLHIDIPLMIGLVLICLLSLVVLYSASGQNMAILYQQMVRMGIAFAVMVILAHVDPQQFKRVSVTLFSIGVALLIAVLVIGMVGKGAQRWLNLGFMRFHWLETLQGKSALSLHFWWPVFSGALFWPGVFILLRIIRIRG